MLIEQCVSSASGWSICTLAETSCASFRVCLYAAMVHGLILLKVAFFAHGCSPCCIAQGSFGQPYT